MAKLILGLVGEMSCGKGTVAEHMKGKYHASAHRFSTILRDVLDRLYLEQSRGNIQILSEILRKNYGEDIFAKSMLHDIEHDGNDIVVVDGVRRIEDIGYLRELAHFKLIFIEADMQIRYDRLTSRRENSDDQVKTFEEFSHEHGADSELQIRELKNYADYVVDNNGSYMDLYHAIDTIVNESMA